MSLACGLSRAAGCDRSRPLRGHRGAALHELLALQFHRARHSSVLWWLRSSSPCGALLSPPPSPSASLCLSPLQATPIVAALFSQLNAQRVQAGKAKLGFLNPL